MEHHNEIFIKLIHLKYSNFVNKDGMLSVNFSKWNWRSDWFGLVLWCIKYCWLFNANSCLYIKYR